MARTSHLIHTERVGYMSSFNSAIDGSLKYLQSEMDDASLLELSSSCRFLKDKEDCNPIIKSGL